MPGVRISPLGPKMREWLNAIPAFSFNERPAQGNAMWMSDAAGGLMEAAHYMCLSAQTQTSLAA